MAMEMINRRKFVGCLGASIGLGSLPVVDAAKDSGPLAGTTAEYEVTSDLGTDEQTTQYVRSAVTGMTAGKVDIAMEIREDGDVTEASARVPKRAVYTEVYGSPSKDSYVQERSGGGVDSTVRSQVSQNSYDHISVQVAGDDISGNLSIDTLSIDGSYSKKRGRAFWLLPQFVSPLLRSSKSLGSGGGGGNVSHLQAPDPHSAAQEVSTNQSHVTGSSTIITKDNGIADITTWQTDFDTQAKTPGNYYSADPNISTSTSLNWSVSETNTEKDVSDSNAVTRGNGRFTGVFAISPDVNTWKGWGHHTHIFYENQQIVFVYGEIEAFSTNPLNFGWQMWDTKVFVNEYRDFGSSQSGKWYII